MGERYPPATYFQYSPSGNHSSHHSIRFPAPPERESLQMLILLNGKLKFSYFWYLAELLTERQKLGPFLQVLPFCSRLLNQEIVRASGLGHNQSFVDSERIEQNSPLRATGHHASGGPMDLEGIRSRMHTEENGYFQRMGVLQTSPAVWNGSPSISASPVVKKVLRMDVPVDEFPHFNFVGRLLGPRGNSLRRVEATTQCRVYIRGRGSIKDSVKEEKLRDKPGYEHLNEPLHVLLDAEFPADIIDARLRQAVNILEDLLKPVDESRDYYKKNQLRELAILNGTRGEESPHMSPSVSPFNSTGMKRAKTGI